MTNQEKLQAVEKKIREVCTELQLDTRGLSDSERVWEEATATPTVHLEHVLRAIASEKFDLGMFVSFRDTTKLHMFPQGNSRKEEYIPMAGISVDTRQWLYNLSLPIADQSEPTIAFLYEVICNH